MVAGRSVAVLGELGGGVEVGEDALADRADEGDRGAAVADACGRRGRASAADDHLHQDDRGIVATGEGTDGQLGEQARDHVLDRQRGVQDLLDQLGRQLMIDTASPDAQLRLVSLVSSRAASSVWLHARPSALRARSLPPEGPFPPRIGVTRPRSG